MIAYIAGPIKGNKNYRKIFNEAERIIREKGFIPLNPANLPEGMPEEKYMPICLSMLEAADAIVLLPGYDESRGATIEEYYAHYQHKLIVPYKSIVNLS